MPPDPGVDWRLWLLAGVGFLGFWVSLFNAWQAYRNAKDAKANRNALQRLDAEHKARSIRLEEFRSSVRDPIRAATSELAPLVRSLAGIANTRTSIDELTEQIAELNGAAMAAIGHVMDALSEANRSRFADGNDWEAGVAAFEDAVGDAFNTALDSDQTHASRLAAVKQAGDQLSALRAAVSNRVDERLEHYAEASGVAPSSASG